MRVNRYGDKVLIKGKVHMLVLTQATHEGYMVCAVDINTGNRYDSPKAVSDCHYLVKKDMDMICGDNWKTYPPKKVGLVRSILIALKTWANQ